MSKVNQGILGSFSGQVGNIVGCVRYGKTYMRSRPTNYHDAKSNNQLRQRSKLQIANAFLKSILPYIRIGYSTFAHQQSAYSAAMSHLLKSAFTPSPDGFSLNYSAVLVAQGALAPALSPSFAIADNAVVFSWDSHSSMSQALSSDLALPLVFNATHTEAQYLLSGVARSDGSCSISLPDSWRCCELHCYLAFSSCNGTSVSSSSYLGSAIRSHE